MTTPEKPTPESLQSALKAEIQDAVQFSDSTLSPQRALATRYYKGEPFGDEEEGRSQVVMPVVRDTAKATLPSLMRVFFGSQRVVEFAPSARMSTLYCEDATELVNYVFTRQNDGWGVTWAAFKDALVRRSGWIKYWWDSSHEVTAQDFTDCTQEQLEALQELTKEGEELQVLARREAGMTDPRPVLDPQTGQPVLDPMTGQPAMIPPQPIILIDARLVKKKPRKQVRIDACSPDEVKFNRDARCLDDARFVMHDRPMRRDVLLSMGVPYDVLDKCSAASKSPNDEQLARSPDGRFPGQSASLLWGQVEVDHYECYWRADLDGDGVAELNLVKAVGQEYFPYFQTIVDEIPFAHFCPDPEPHTIEGLSQADSVMDLQLIESHVVRDMLDSLKASIFPRTSYVEGQVNADDVLNTEIGAAIRKRSVDAFQVHDVPFSGEKAFPMLSFLRDTREERTGINKSNLGLDPSALQSTTQVAAAASVTNSQAQVELIARVFAEGGMKRVFRGILKLLVRHQNEKMEVAINGRVLEVNPATWDPDLEVVVNTGLGTGASAEQKIAVLANVAAQQKEALASLGPDSPLCSLQEFFNTQRAMLELAGFRDTHRYWRDPERAMQEGKTLPEPQPTPEQVVAQATVAIEQEKSRTKQLEVILVDDRERDKNEIDAYLRAIEIGAKYGTAVDVKIIDAIAQKQRAQAQAARAGVVG